MQRNDLVTDDVVSRRKLSGEYSGNFKVVLDHCVGDPGSGSDDSGLGDLGPFKGTGGEGRAVSYTVISLRRGN